MKVAPNGKITSTVMGAIRVVGEAGRMAANMVAHYDSSSEKITGFRAWLVRPDGDGKSYRIKDAMDSSISASIYTEQRHIRLSVSDEAYKDCIFAYEYTKESRRIFGQNMWNFQSSRPVALSRLTYTLPKGWSVRGTMSRGKAPEPVVAGNSHTWEMRNLPAVRSEPMGPTFWRIVPRLNIDVFPPVDMANPPIVSFSSWADVSEFNCKLLELPTAPDAAVGAKTRELLASAGPGLWDRVSALARHAQSINYISIQMNLGRGGGYTPRPAPEVLRTGYGDCKDKTTLLRSMLKVAGIESYPVVVYSGDRHRVTDDWPTPMVFNHMIIAIRIDDPSVTSPAIVEHPAFGRLLFFDPTDPHTPPGDLFYKNQGALVLVLDGGRGELVRLPFTPPAANHTERTVTVWMDMYGSIAASITEHMTGQSAAKSRAAYRMMGAKYPQTITKWIGETVRLAKVGNTEGIDDPRRGTFDMKTGFVAPGYANMVRDKLLVFKPAIVSRRDLVPFTPTARRVHPVFIEPVSYDETTDIRIPDGFAVEELPEAVEKETSFGRYSAKYVYDAGTQTIRCTRALSMSAVEIPAKEHATVRDFYEMVRKAEQAPVVLGRQ
jgi:transglutaminase-like putative cysteine protease